MPRVIGIDIPANKKLRVSLTYLYGIGKNNVQLLLDKAHLDGEVRASELTAEDISKLNALLQSEYLVEGDLRRQVQNNIKRLVSINSYRGQRHRTNLPVRGQRTSSNARTRKGKKKTVANKKK